MTREERENALHCLKVMLDEEVCEECKLYGSTGTDHCEADCVRVAIKALEQEPCEDCISREAVLNAIIKELCIKDENYLLQSEKTIYDVVKNIPSVNPQEPKTDYATERYKDLEDYFSDKDIAKTILENQTEFKAWLERVRWHTTKVDELARKLETLEQEPKTGQWYHYEGMIKCTKCNMEFYDDIMEYCGDAVPRYCPNCGANMESEG